MNDDLRMNDTLDDFTFTQTENICTKLNSLKNKDSPVYNDSFKSCGSSTKSELRSISTKGEISLDDSIFLPESLSLSSNDVLQNTGEKEEKEIPTILQENKNLYNAVDKNNINVEFKGCNYVTVAISKSRRSNKEIENMYENDGKNIEQYANINNLNKNKSELNLCKKTLPNRMPNLSNQEERINDKEKNMSNEKPCKKQNVNNGENKISFNSENKISFNSENKISFNSEMCKLSSWGLPQTVLEKYESRNIKNMFLWQVECLSNVNILNDCKNLVYSAPTSSGKTLVAEILAIKTIFERQKKVIFILPFVSIVREKMYYFQDILGSSGIRVEGFMGSYNPPGGFGSVQVAICTIEKANSLINRLLEEGKLCDIGAILVDEVHLLGDPSRGYLLELLLTKLRYISTKNENINIQIVGMSATLPNLSHLAKWLDADLYTTNFRPIPLYEQAHVCGEIYDNNLKLIRKMCPLDELGTDTDNILQLCLETIKESCSVLIFCPTKNWCENLSQQIATAFFKIGSSKSTWGELLRSQLNTNLIMELLGQLKYCPVGLDDVLRKTVSFGVAFHHAGLTMDERDIIEGAFRNGALRILVATSTLSSGVNLPARRVIIRTPNFHGKPIDTLTYRQMIGRAGRMGRDAIGESILICQKNDYKIAKELMSAQLKPVESCLEGTGKLKRAILEVIASGVASSPNDVNLFTKCTLLAVTDECTQDLNNPIEEAVNFLKNNEFIRLQIQEDGTERYVATSLGKACLSSSIAPDEGLALFTELEKARQCFVLETELHLIYLVTPYSACNSWGNIDWMFYLELWERLPLSMRKVAELVGVRESYIINATRGKIQTSTTLALQDLVSEKPLGEVCAKFNCNRGMLQSLQQAASSFAGMVTSFSRELGWTSVEILISQFQERMQFGVSRDLLDLMRLPILNGKMARILYNAGIDTVIQLANSDVATIENILHRVVPFETEKERDGESEFEKKQRNKFKNIWVTGKEGLTEREAAEILVSDARRYLKLEMGLADAKWKTDAAYSSEESVVIDNADSVIVRQKEKSTEECFEENVNSVEKINCTIVIYDSVRNVGNIMKKDATRDATITGKDNFYSSKKNSSFSNINFTDIETNLQNDLLANNISIETKSLSSSSSSRNIENCENSEPSNGHIQANNFSNSSSFSDINFTNIEENLARSNNLNRSWIKNTIMHCSKSFKIPQNTFPKNEVSQLLMSPSEVELNISDSSIFSSHSNNISVENIKSDQSLFEDSFTLHLSESDKDSSQSSGITQQNQASNELNISNDILTSSVNEDVPDVSRKRKHNNSGQCSTTPSKKTRNSKDRKVVVQRERSFLQKSEQLNASYVESKLQEEESADFSKFDIVNVCTHISLLELFQKELMQQKCICLSLACSKVMEKRSLIGMNIIKQEVDNEDSKRQNKFCYNERGLDGFAITWDGSTVYYLSLTNAEYNSKVLKILKSILGSKSMQVRLFDSKEQLKVLQHCCAISFKSKIDDPKVADWILDPEGKEKNLQALVVKYCPEAIKLAQLSGGCKGVGSVALDLHSSIDSKIRSSVEAVITWHLVYALKSVLKETNPNYLNIYDVEMDTISCLAKMEINGISVSKDILQKLVDTLKNQMTFIEKKAFCLAGRHFNFVSSTEVAKVIDDVNNFKYDLGMFRGKKVSTRKQVLEQNAHPISDLVLQWRKLNCTLTKMIYPLIRIIENQHIHGCYITHTATGRITMHEPNLQNITKDFEIMNPLTKENVKISCRSAFQVPDNFSLVSADYCQLELRILAHLSQDELLCNIMRQHGDVFRSIAAKWNKIEEDKVDESIRQNAKHLCYGIIYGMGSKTLADQLLISEEDAVVFMDTFRNTYPGIKKFAKETIDSCRIKGYVETISGRRSVTALTISSEEVKTGQAERQAVNTTVQGSAADIAKKAMVKIEQELQDVFGKTKNKPKLVLHLHDELMYEVPSKYLRKVARIVKRNMENSVQLSIPFPVKLKTGKSWGQMTEYIL
ncbi:hypothetical protein NQ314_008417 [Rhamnusium bicolor]|uniref:DNA-directed DNA polymerase n=1 Tax=Rhamnusium bicolor TaxID=1586634 RepID=A0AAV8YAA8_9CUCU|nr:hypothetical protein NQ314_008417 [Rhamnusium bicolor]